MDFLDPKKQFRHRIILLLGYVLVAVAITIGTIVLVYQAYGFGLAKNGTVIQTGLLFFSSHPNPADIYVDGTKKSVRTNTRLSLPANIYKIELRREGYHSWHRSIDLQGGSVEHFDYPFLIPKKLTTKSLQPFANAPQLASQSPDKRWLLIAQPDTRDNFFLYDLKNPAKAATTLSLPADLVSSPGVSESWLPLSEWADDNRHVVLQRKVDDKIEFILVDRADPAQSVNVSEVIKAGTAKLALKDKKFDQYYLYDEVDHSIKAASLKEPEVKPVLSRVLAYHSYGDDTILYATDNGASAGKVLIKMLRGNQTFTLRALPSGTSYLLDLTKYENTFYVAMSAASTNKVYIYKDPIGQLAQPVQRTAVPTQVLHVPNPDYLSFSPNAQFIVAEGGQRFGVYDIENQTGYNYTTTAPLDMPQTHATWMDGHRLTYVSAGKLLIFDYDNTNPHALVSASSNFTPYFTPDYKYVQVFAPTTTPNQQSLAQTSLLAPADR